MKKAKILLVILSICLFKLGLKAQSDSLHAGNGFIFEASYIGDNVNNLKGGIKNGSCYLGMANIQLMFDTEKAGWWKGTEIYVNAANTHGAEPSANFIGDMQVASNIEAGNHTYIQEFWFKQAFKNFELTLGLQDLNVEFAASSEHGGLYLNSSFGILPIISANVPAPIFPLTSIGITTKLNFNEKTSWLFACYDGSPTDFDYNPYNLKWQLNSGDGILIVSEIQLSSKIRELLGICKLGFYNHNHLIEKHLGIELPDSLNTSIYGVYAYADQKIWQKEDRNIGIFVQFGYSPSDNSLNKYYAGFGLNFTGIFSVSGSDVLGLAIAHEGCTDKLGKETTIELTYQRQMTSNIFIQPDFQYIINPSGQSSGLDNAFVASLRFGLSF
jgi:porin